MNRLQIDLCRRAHRSARDQKFLNVRRSAGSSGGSPELVGDTHHSPFIGELTYWNSMTFK
jgi:hypothetical protein